MKDPQSREIPAKYEHHAAEERWRAEWDTAGIHRWDPSRPREETFVVDTPPPTVSGSLHIGHVYSYTQTDIIVRYHRMRGKNIFYPIGWDDNGLGTERRVQNYFGILCDPSLPYDPEWRADITQPAANDAKAKPVSRRNFIEACALLTAEDERAFEALFRNVALSFDWSLQYATIDERCRRVSQFSFLDLVERGHVYHTLSPTMWDVD